MMLGAKTLRPWSKRLQQRPITMFIPSFYKQNLALYLWCA
jgi:hypothetical protein